MKKRLIAAAFVLAITFTLTFVACGKHGWESTEEMEEGYSSSSLKPGSSGPAKPSSSSVPGQSGVVYGTPVTYEGETYQTVVIGSQTWMAKNLNYDVPGSVCYAEGGRYVSADSLAKNCTTYGRFYTWATAMAKPSSYDSNYCALLISAEHRGICPEGWHIPSGTDWDNLLRFVDNANGHSGKELTTFYEDKAAGKYLKATSGWYDYNGKSGNGTDIYGFAALPSGRRDEHYALFYDFGEYGYWWSSTEESNRNADCRYMNNYDDTGLSGKNKSGLHNVRCVKDNSSATPSKPSSSSVSEAIHGTPVTYAGETYETVVIGTQTWMAKNFNYDVPSNSTDVCYNNNPANCATYGRLYDWATAMDLPSNCNTSSCSDQIQPKHQGICPSGWHIPNNAERNVLMKTINPSCKDNNNCIGAGTKLKAASSWDVCGNGTDNYGFSALPGGRGYSRGTFEDINRYSHWWSSSEDSEEGNDYANCWGIPYDYDRVDWFSAWKSSLFSVRCLKD